MAIHAGFGEGVWRAAPSAAAHGLGPSGEDYFVPDDVHNLQFFLSIFLTCARLPPNDSHRLRELLDLARHTLVLADVHVDALHPGLVLGRVVGRVVGKDELANRHVGVGS